MSIFLYANGLTEEHIPEGHTFTDVEIYGIFKDFSRIRSYRLREVPNTWCVWGQRSPIDKKPDEFNQVGTDILEQKCFSPILFIHDTEINPAWQLTEDIILNGYGDFKRDLVDFFDDIAKDLIDAREQARIESGHPPNLMVLEESGVSEDKRIIFNFNMERQVQEFFQQKNIEEFANKVHKFLKFSYKDGDIFAIYADKNIIIVIEDSQVKDFIDKVIAFFESKENYEACSVIRNTYKKWINYKDSKKKSKENNSKKDNSKDNSKDKE